MEKKEKGDVKGRQRQKKKKNSCTPETEERIRVNEIIGREGRGGGIYDFSTSSHGCQILHTEKEKETKKKKKKQRHEHREKDRHVVHIYIYIYEDEKKGRKNKKKMAPREIISRTRV